jgi:exonuclease SbcD
MARKQKCYNEQVKLLITSDWHIDAKTGGVVRYPELCNFFTKLEDYIIDNRIDIMCNLGDYFDPGKLWDLQNSARLIEHAVRLNNSCELGSIWITGNHDVVNHTEGSTCLTPLESAKRAYGYHADSFNKVNQLHIVQTPDVIRVEGCSLSFLCLPYPISARMDDYNKQVQDAFSQCDGKTTVVLSHLNIEGAQIGSESQEMAKGIDISLPIDRLKALNPLLIFNGHYHKPQTIKKTDLEIHIPGSPLRFTFGEKDDEKGFILVEI